jgi:DNA-binding protein Fis
VNRVERELIAQMLAACGGVQLKAAARLGINRNTLRKKLVEHGLDTGDEAST